jgi:hypothetical protein
MYGIHMEIRYPFVNLKPELKKVLSSVQNLEVNLYNIVKAKKGQKGPKMHRSMEREKKV